MPLRAIVVLALGGLFALAGAMMATLRLPRRMGIGMRSASMRVSDAAWEAGHRAVAIPLIVFGVANLALGIWMFASYGRSPDTDQAITGTRAAVWYIAILALVLMVLSSIADFKARVVVEAEAASRADQPGPDPESP